MIADSQSQLDTRAIEIAKEALTRIDAHEQLANERHMQGNERYTQIVRSLDGLFSEIRNQNRRWLFVSGSIILGLLSITGFLTIKVLGL